MAAYPPNGGMFAPMMGISGMSNQDGGVSPFAQSPNGVSNQQFQDPNAWLNQMLNSAPGQASAVQNPMTATASPADPSAGVPSSPTTPALPTNPLAGQFAGSGTVAATPTDPAIAQGAQLLQQMFSAANSQTQAASAQPAAAATNSGAQNQHLLTGGAGLLSALGLF